MEGDRLIFHCDCNAFFASCECIGHPELANVPMAVAGDPENRRGIVLAKNEPAKRYGVKTTDTVNEARSKCPGIVFVPPHHRLYAEISRRVNAIYLQYTDYVEPASIDESYLDMTGAPEYFGMTPEGLADALRERVRTEIGITISVGVSFCKVFAKMGSDYRKPDATTLITRENFREILWPLPLSDLMFAGKAAVGALNKKFIRTVGDLANRPRDYIVSVLGKSGALLWAYANGLDGSRVRLYGDVDRPKSVSHGMTFRRDLVTRDEVRTGLGVLVDEVARSLRRQGLKGCVVQVTIKRPELTVIQRQVTLDHYTCLQHEIAEIAMDLIEKHWEIGPRCPIRALTVGVGRLTDERDEVRQTTLFDGETENAAGPDRSRQEKLESAVDALRLRFGNEAITLGYQENREIGIERKHRQ